MSSTTVERYERALAACGLERALVTIVLSTKRHESPVAGVALEAPASFAPEPPQDYPALVRRVTEIVSGLVEPGASVLVVSRGDPDLLKLSPAIGAHFPQGEDGAFAGFYPRDGASAVAHLHKLREGGACYLVIPATCTWWLDHYGALASYLLTSSRALHHNSDCLLFDLRPERNQSTS